MTNRKTNLVLIVLLSIVSGLLLGNILARRSNQVNTPSIIESLFKSSQYNKNKLAEILSIIDGSYVDSVNVNDMTEEIIIDLISKLDPHSSYIPAADLELVNNELEGSFSGIGVQFNIQNDTVTIVSVINGGPSEKVGVLAGDRIVQVDDSAFVGKNISNERVMKQLRGKEGTKVKLGIARHGAKDMLKYEITRGQIPVKSVDVAYMVSPGVGFIKISKFAATTYSEFLTAIAGLRSKGAQKYIIDLRENSGGYMEQAINMINEFLPARQLIVYSEGKAYPRFEAKANGKGSALNAPIVVLIDEFSASASEIFAGAIQDNDRGTVIGRRSFGKGLVQQQVDLSDGSALRLTVARYYTPSGRSIQKPYEIGNGEEYEKDLINRFLHGEFDNKDSIQVKDSMQYKTLKGRTVYGGGGIMPDIFIARDTTEYSNYLNSAINYGYLYQFAFKYTDQHRDKLNNIKTWQEMDKYLESQNIVQQFVNFAQTKGVQPNAREIAKSRRILDTQLKAYIIRNILNDEGFFPMFYKNDQTVLKAIEVLNKQKS